MELTESDKELVQAATDAINKLYKLGKHHVGAAVRAKSGRIVTGVNVDTYVGRVGVCAEAIALGRMMSEGEEEFSSIVAVYKPRPDSDPREPYIASPCGACREMIIDYCPDATVFFVEDGLTKKAGAMELLPGKYIKR